MERRRPAAVGLAAPSARSACNSSADGGETLPLHAHREPADYAFGNPPAGQSIFFTGA
jgi:hypothetical protein